LDEHQRILPVSPKVSEVVTARSEEAENVRYFGAAYQEYVRRTKMFIPLVF
jgi:protein-S-isoprenylcysteine O-methyltransferase Ste14